MKKYTYGIFVSGALGLDCLKSVYQKHNIIFVFTDKKSADIISFCKELRLPFFSGNPRGGLGSDFVKGMNVDIILSINYLFIIEPDLISKANMYAINFHGSLLPKYRGRTPHVWAIINNENETGISAHLIEQGCDSGDIVYQEQILIEKHSTGADILKKFTELYPTIIEKVIMMLESGQVNLVVQDESKATFFGKRTPDDGEIQWYWQKERIYNWVRALAYPYPGAFTNYQNIKIIIDRVEYSDIGFNENDRDGLILIGGKNPIVKTSNGAIKLEISENYGPLIFKKGEILHARY